MLKTSAIGISTGTSFDAIDVVKVEFEDSCNVIEFKTIPIPEELKIIYTKCYSNQNTNVKEISYLDSMLGNLLVEAVSSLNDPSADIIGCSGQTIWHQVDEKPYSTWQITDVSKLASTFKIPVAHEFRKLDLAFGGQGAPVAMTAHE